METTNSRLMQTVALANDYCVTIENVTNFDKAELVATLTSLLPKLYTEFLDNQVEALPDETYISNYIDEVYYDSVLRNIGMVLGEDDVFLETFEEDMKYSESPIAVSISELLADIFQDLYNFVYAVKDTDGDLLVEAFAHCKENFDSYWSQKLCNVMRPLNHLRLTITPENNE